MATKTQRHVASVAAYGLFLLFGWINTSIAASRTDVSSPADPDACTLLKTEEVSKALGVTSLAGARLVASSPKVCIWSDDPNHGVGHRRVTLSITSMAGFQFGKSGASKQFTVETASGIGDEAYYELFRSDSPFLVVRKGNAAFNVRVLNGLSLKGFTLEEEKTKEADLAKAAASRL
jgi:hypothetical protein